VTQRGEADVKATIRNGEVRVSCHAYNAPADVVLATSVLEPHLTVTLCGPWKGPSLTMTSPPRSGRGRFLQ
jgi:hypothetical protein